MLFKMAFSAAAIGKIIAADSQVCSHPVQELLRLAITLSGEVSLFDYTEHKKIDIAVTRYVNDNLAAENLNLAIGLL